VSLELSVSSVADDLKGLGCQVTYIAPEYQPVPTAEVIPPVYIMDEAGHEHEVRPGRTVEPDPKLVKEAVDFNAKQRRLIDAALATHRARIRQGAEVAIQVVRGHGGSVGGSCGTFGFQVDSPQDLLRDDFHARNYSAVKGDVPGRSNVCRWFVADFSCASGLTPFAIDGLSNAGRATCWKKPAASCASRAAHDLTIAVGSAHGTEICRQGGIALMKAGVRQMVLQRTLAPARLPPSVQNPQVVFPSRYSDGGLKICEPHVRQGY
jgi:hypothetical protein